MKDILHFSDSVGGLPASLLQSNLSVHCDAYYGGRVLPVSRLSAGRPKYQINNTWESARWMERFIGQERIESFNLELDGKRLHNHWDLLDISSECVAKDRLRAVMRLKHKYAPVEVSLFTQADGTAFFEQWIEIANKSPAPVCLSRIDPMSGIAWLMQNERNLPLTEVYELGFYDDTRTLHEGSFRWMTLPEGKYTISSKTGRSGWGVPFFMVKNRHNGEYLACSLEWSGNWQAELEVIPRHSECRSVFTFNIGPSGSAPLYVIEPGECLTSPRVHYGLVRGGPDACSAEFHKHIRRSVLRQSVSRDFLPLTAARVVEGGVDWLKNEVERAAAAGMEHFLVDAGWYGAAEGDWFNTTGDWQPGKWLEGGLDAFRDVIHAKGMKFGLWMELESVGSRSRLAAAHPEYLAERDDLPICGKRMLDLAKPEVEEFVRTEVLRVIREYKPDMLKIDFNFLDHGSNRNVGDFGENLRSGVMENSGWRHVRALYGIFDEVGRLYPDLYLENCAAGGGRNDLGILRRFDVMCHSDYTSLPRALFAVNNLTLAFPPETLRYYFGHWDCYHLYGDFDFQVRAALFANPLIVGFGNREVPFETAEVIKLKHYAALYKSFIRPLMRSAVVHHHTGMLSFNGDDPYCVLEYAAEDASRAMIGVFRLTGDADSMVRVFPKKIIDEGLYSLTADTAGTVMEIEGRALRQDGYQVRLDGAFTSELILLRRTGG